MITFSCNNKNKVKYNANNKKYLFITTNLHNVFDHYYLTFDHYPKNMQELFTYLNIDKDSIKFYFEDPFHPKKIIKYIPVFEKDSIYPFEYFLTSNNTKIAFFYKNNLDTINNIFAIFEKDSFYTKKPVIYFYSNKLLVRSSAMFPYHFIANQIRNNKQFYDMIFQVKKNDINFKKNKIYIDYKKDNLTLNCKIFSNKVINKLKENNYDSIKLIGYKYKYSNDTVYLKNVKIYKDTLISGYYFDEIGNKKRLPLEILYK
jgi:hypothetical protein